MIRPYRHVSKENLHTCVIVRVGGVRWGGGGQHWDVGKVVHLQMLSMVGVRRKRDGEPCACTKAVWGPVHGAQSCWASFSFFYCGLEFVVGGPNDALLVFGWSDQDEGQDQDEG
ncbi:hypothetical protein PanWU01x14_173990 [Parasponia andersonii]|uniref:Uncharacterized protein n=1 Tax=Parasponia andersonii TaxID=3476 RepID=A0A2P5C8Y3_PARAD|nr:hypothetical protein PanWU01x14_173990 [Parasponia andersonii]